MNKSISVHRLLLFLVIVFASLFVGQAQNARFQLIHNSGDTALQTMDVWLDSVKVYDNLTFRSSSAFINVDANVEHEVFFCNKSSVDTSNAFFKDSVYFEAGGDNLLFINGFVSTGYSPSVPLGFNLFEAAQSQAQLNGFTDILFYQGVSDFGTMDIYENGMLNQNIEDNLEYNTLTQYRSLESLNYLLQIRENGKNYGIREIILNLASSGLSDSAITVVISGFKNPASNNNGSSIQVYIVPKSGGNFLPLANSFAEVQIIHNSADPALPRSDFYVGSNKVSDDLTFRTATPYFNVASGVLSVVGVGSSSSTSVNDTLLSNRYILEANRSYILTMNGLVSQSIIPFEPLKFDILASKKTASLGYNTDIVFIHGSTDAGAISVDETTVLNTALFSSVSYGDVSNYKSIPSARYQFQLMDEANQNVLEMYVGDYLSTSGSAETWVLSGFSDTLSSDSTNRIGIWVATATGGDMHELYKPTGLGIVNLQGFKIYPNPCSSQLHIIGLDLIDAYDLIDPLGKSVAKGNEAIINVADFECGIYTLIIQSQGETFIKKVALLH